jgi:hypothetical protein
MLSGPVSSEPPDLALQHGREVRARRANRPSEIARLCDSYFQQGRQLVKIDWFANVVIKASSRR